jgi:hypothetical protein
MLIHYEKQPFVYLWYNNTKDSLICIMFGTYFYFPVYDASVLTAAHSLQTFKYVMGKL